MIGIAITRVAPVAGSDPRGQTVELFKSLPGRQVTLYRRNAGTTFANHFHKGDDPSKNPELFFLIDGEVELHAWNKATGEEELFRVAAGNQITIEKDVYHEFKAITDVAFLEYRATVFDPLHPDCYTKEEYFDIAIGT